ncbi:transcriptional regulator, AraC family with amidase-like domain [Duganella sp. CF402]|uniref:GlxA family transcriptional regulator n=1 Tax=unclassified Duganella TaxID=2636909 RepID=UPI0008D47D7C|nr:MULTISPECIES: GlxA family transcriptional regulator [unclassified Duganella]RZT10205.1 AraC family transcriptional regulator with amidase-like domain [Duganella sp. BK701]SEL23506.1 transcriptional regulator, AraC family with amidase-like domain [Duganella sp. CF402]
MHRIGFFLTERFQIMALGTQSVFEFANVVAREQVYQVKNYSVAGGEIRSSQGVSINTLAAGTGAEADSWLISGVVDPIAGAATADEAAFIRRASTQARRTVGLCTGAFFLGQAGLLDGRRATTHWAYAEALKARHPLARIEPDRIFIVDGPIWTSAGLTAAMDLALGMVEKDLGPEIATSVARVLVMDHRRSGGQSQKSELLKLAPKSDRIQKALAYARKSLALPLRVDDLAREANLSPRQFSRIFQSETGKSPAKAIEQLRVEAARNMIERGRHPLEVIARETGFRDREHLREVFVRELGVAPQSLRREARSELEEA